VSRLFALTGILVLTSLTAPITRAARAQDATMTVTILRRTAVHANPSYAATTIGFLNPSTIAVTQLKVDDGFVRVPLRQIDRRWPATGYGYIAAVDVDVDSGTTNTRVRARPDTSARARPTTVTALSTRTDTTAPPRPAAAAAARTDTTTAARADIVAPRTTTPSATDLIIRPDAPPSTPNAVDSPDLSFLKQGPLTAILQRPVAFQVGNTRDSITVPAGFVTDFTSIPRALWPELSPVGEHQRAVIVHDYLYWFQPCEREESDNLLMIAMKQNGMPDLQRGAVFAGVRIGSADVWNANRAARDRGDLKIVPPQIRPTAQESWSDFRTRLGKADIRGTPGRMPRQKFCDYGRAQQVP
jgi:hypothetical protein